MSTPHCAINHDHNTHLSQMDCDIFIPNKSNRSFLDILHDEYQKYTKLMHKSYGDLFPTTGLFNLGCANFENNPEVAADKVFQREYPHIWNGTKELAEFIPENFFGRTTSMIEEDFTTEQLHEREQESQTKVKVKSRDKTSALYLNSSHIEGDKAERCLFDKFKNMFTSKLNGHDLDVDSRNVVVLHGIDLLIDEMQQELDFVIISPKRKLFVVVECKNDYDYQQKNNKTKVKKALKQLKTFKQFMGKFYSDILEEGWQFRKTLYFHNFNIAADEQLCEECSPWVLTKDSNVSEWWKVIEYKHPLLHDAELESTMKQFKKLFGLLVFVMHKKQSQISTSRTVERLFADITTKIGTANNILFWTKEQRDLLTNEANKFVMFFTTYGTGKTLLMREKSEHLAKRGEKVIYILFANGTGKSLLQISLEKRFNVYGNNVKVVTTRDIMLEVVGDVQVSFLSGHLLEYVKKNPDYHIMIDEWYWFKDDPETFVKCLDACKNIFLWISWHRNTKNSWNKDTFLGLREACKEANFVVPSLIHPMRNSRLIIETAKDHGGKQGNDILLPSNYYSEGISPSHIELDDSSDEVQVKLAFHAAIETARKRSMRGIVIIMNAYPIGGLTAREFNIAVEAIKEICQERNEICTVYFTVSLYETENYVDVKLFLAENKGMKVIEVRINNNCGGCQASRDIFTKGVVPSRSLASAF